MRISILVLAVCLGLGAIAGTAALAEEKHGWPTLSLTGGIYSFADETDLGSEPLYGVKLGYEINGDSLSNRLGVEAVYHYAKGTIKASQADIDASQIRLDVLYLFNPLKKAKNLTPFFAVGAGGLFVDGDLGSDTDPVVAYGLGCKFPLTSALSLRADVRHVLVFSAEQLDEFELTAGLHYRFGQPKKIKKQLQAVVDSDNDGIIDGKDQCPETPTGLKVNAQGCPLNPPDTDRDGVPDYLDRCPDTPPGYSVDDDGCLLDSDRDGVPDPFDQCPNNPPGFEVNADGCMKISN